MNRSRSQLDAYQLRQSSLRKPGYLPKTSRRISPITSNGHKYELKQKNWPKQTVESWFENHSADDRRAVYSFLNTIYVNDDDDDDRTPIIKQTERRPERSLNTRFPTRIKSSLVVPPSSPPASPLLQRQPSNQSGRVSRASKRDLGEILESLESLRPSLLVQNKGIQTSATPITCPLPNVTTPKIDEKVDKQFKRPVSSIDKHIEVVQPTISIDSSNNNHQEENTKVGRRYLSHTWRVINPREDMEPNVRPENNSSSFFQFTKKVYPEYFFIHPDWY